MNQTNISVQSDIDIYSVIEAICVMDEDDIFEFVVELDNQVANFDLTNRLKTHFVNEIGKEEDVEDDEE